MNEEYTSTQDKTENNNRIFIRFYISNHNEFKTEDSIVLGKIDLAVNAIHAEECLKLKFKK